MSLLLFDMKKTYIVGVGASAGGLEALIALLNGLPGNIDMALVLIQHLEPQHKSVLTEILARETSLAIREADNNTKVEPAHIYVIPPNVFMAISRNTLKITPRTKHLDGKYLPVDFFMTSLAEDQGDKAIGVILSGTGSDGTLGSKAIKAKGGLIFAQDEKTAKYYGMPQSVISSGCVDFILEPKAIAGKLAEISLHPYKAHGKPLRKTEPQVSDENVLDKILILLRDFTGADFIHYKRTTINRRIMRRMAFHDITRYSDYLDHLKNNPSEAEVLHKDILIPVTTFFRDPGAFSILKDKVFPLILRNRPATDPVRIWVPACSTGEEAYSIAICFYEFLEEIKVKSSAIIFGTDMSEILIAHARSASYKEDISAHVSSERLRRFFIKSEAGYKIGNHIRELCIFSTQDVTRAPPLSNMDIVSCRNVLIYFNAVLQEKALSMLHYALRPGGFLVLGTSESPGALSNHFTGVDKKYKIYSKNITAQRFPPNHYRMQDLEPKPPADNDRKACKKIISKDSDTKAEATRRIFEAAKSVKAKAKHGERSVSQLERDLARAEKRLQAVAEEKDTYNEELMGANEEIQSSNEELQSMNEELETSKEELQSTNEELVTLNEELQNRNAELTLLNSDLNNIFSSTNIPMIIVGNDLCIRRFTPMARKVMNLIATDTGRPIGDIKLNIEIADLERMILNVIESMNTKETEAQDREGRWYSMRIRPYRTVDNKIDGAVIAMLDIDVIKRSQNELKEALNYAQAIMETMSDSLLVLDKELRVLSANKSFYQTFEVSVSDVENHLIYELGNRQWDLPGLRELLEEILPRKTYFDNFEVPFDFLKTDRSVMSFSARQIYSQGREKQMILLIIKDITGRKKAEEELRAHELAVSQLEREKAKRLSDIGTLAATVAHELRNPLATIAMAASNIRRKAQNPLLAGHLDNIEKKIVASEQIINNLLFYSRLKPPHYENINIHEILTGCVNLMHKRCAKKISIRKKLHAVKDILIEADPFQIAEVFSNILNNACDAVSEAKGMVEIGARNDIEFIKIYVKDNGMGIDKKDLEAVFAPFFTTKAKGTGLGLSVCHQIVNFHDGAINVESEPGKGATFTVSLPKKRIN